MASFSGRRYLNTFRGEPAISRFAWHFTSTHRSSRWFAIHPGSGLHERVPPASPCPWVAHLVSGRFDATRRPFGLAFAPAPAVPALASPRRTTRWLILQKARRHTAYAMLRPARGARFQALFHSPRRGAFHRSLTVLVPYRSLAVFSLGWWSTQLPTRFRVSGSTHGSRSRAHSTRRLRDSHPVLSPVPEAFGCASAVARGVRHPLHLNRSTPERQRQRARTPSRFGLLPVRSPLLGESSLFLAVLRCFTSRGSLPDSSG